MQQQPEIELFSSVFFEPNSIHDIAPLVSVEDFVMDEHRSLYSSILQLLQENKPIDPVHVSQQLSIRGINPERASELISRATDGCPLAGHAKSYALLVHEAARKRRIVKAMELLQIRALEPGANATELVEVFQQKIFELQSDRPHTEIATLLDATRSFLNQATIERKATGELVGISTGIGGLDLSTTGLRPGEFWIAGALPGRGKTALGLQVSSGVASNGVPVAFFSQEMTKEELVRRIIGERFGVWTMRNIHSMPETQWARAQEYAAEISQWPMYVEDASSLSAFDISARARASIRNKGVKLVVVDYLQLLKGNERDRRDRIGNAANVLRQLAKETKIPVLALSQLRRPDNLNDRPTMIDLKESGDIEAHAHTVLLIYMPMAQDDQPKGEDEIIIGKQRNGPLGSVPVYFDKRTLSFKERT